MAAEGLIEPLFSLAIDRTPCGIATSPGSFFRLRAIAPVAHSPSWACTPVVILPQIPISLTGNKSECVLKVEIVRYCLTSNTGMGNVSNLET